MRATALLSAAASGLALSAQPAWADASTTMVISATVLPSCRVESGAMAFGSVAGDQPQTTAQAALALECTPGTAYTVTMDQGLHGGRRMAGGEGGGYLDYEIYRDAAATQRWGTMGAGAVSGVTPGDGKVTLSAYGRITDASAAPGQYGDIVTVMVEF